jgi:hypothetical protein
VAEWALGIPPVSNNHRKSNFFFWVPPRITFRAWAKNQLRNTAKKAFPGANCGVKGVTIEISGIDIYPRI